VPLCRVDPRLDLLNLASYLRKLVARAAAQAQWDCRHRGKSTDTDWSPEGPSVQFGLTSRPIAWGMIVRALIHECHASANYDREAMHDVPGLVVCRWCHTLGPDAPESMIQLPTELEATAICAGWSFEPEVSEWICPECIVRRDKASEN
jgi:hypothetical protein